MLLVPAAQGSTKLKVITDGTCHLSSVVFCLLPKPEPKSSKSAL